jgi:hypothetical protein
MFARCSKISDEEKQWHSEGPREVVATTVLRFGIDNPTKSKGIFPVKIHTYTPVRALFPLAENKMARDLNNCSNYTTNPYDASYGFPPIKSVTHKHNSNTVLIQTSDQASKIEPWYHATSAPVDIGYNMYSHSYQPGSLQADVGLTYTQKLGAELSLAIDSSNPLIEDHPIPDNDPAVLDERLEREANNIKDDDIDNNIQYIIHVYALTFITITFNKNSAVRDDKIIIDSGISDLVSEDSTNSSPNRLSSTS